MVDYLSVNRASWDERAPAHAASPDYAVQRLLSADDQISDVVSFDRPLLGDLSGLDGVHLQCHIGTDTLSLARLGARMTGLDLSPASLDQARSLAQAAGVEIPYVESNVYEAPEALAGKTFDLVYTGIGALCWLPSIDRWAQVVSQLLRPGGRLFVREGHPMLWALDESETNGLRVRYPYFEQADPLVFDDDGTYVETDHVFTASRTMVWNHGIGEVVTALHRHGLSLTGLVEHDSVPWDALPGQMKVDDQGEYRLTDNPARLPCTYTVQAVKNAPQ